MGKIQQYAALKLCWDLVSEYVGNLISNILKRQIICRAKCEDDSYWSVATTEGTFTKAEIACMVQAVNGNDRMLSHSLPSDSNTSKSLSMELCQELLKQAISLQWEASFITEDALWIVGNISPDYSLPKMSNTLLYLDGTMIDCSELTPIDAFVEKLFDEGGTFTELTELCADYEVKYGDPLYWMHPFTDGKYNGCYFVLVREGVLVLSYDEINDCDHEIFIRDSAHLCDADEMRCFLHEWITRTAALQQTIHSLLTFLEAKEEKGEWWYD